MNTPSHFLMTAALAKALPRVSIAKRAFLWGSIAPDLPLWLLSIGGMVYYHQILGWSLAETSQMMFDKLYFEHPVWIVSHNFLHAPIVLLVGLAIASRLRQRFQFCHGLFWFLLACLLHSVVDILTHVTDGPLLFFPLDWQTRFRSAVSYYDDRYYGREFSIFELTINLFFLVYVFGSRLYQCVYQFGDRCYRSIRAKIR